MMTPLMKGFDPRRFDRELRSPQPAVTQFATESAIWRGEHGVTDARLLVGPSNLRRDPD
jgi:hypothetical protein